MNQIKVKIERIVPEGKGVGFSIDGSFAGKAIYILGAYPGETVLAEIFREKNGFVEAKLIEVIEATPNRISPLESHHTSHSPWQTIEYEYQLELKKDILRKCFHSLASTELSEDLEFFESPKKVGYRTKLEFSFDEDPNYIMRKILAQDSKIIEKTEKFLAFHERGSNNKMLRINFDKNVKEFGCSLGNDEMNNYASIVLDLINKSKLIEFDLKTLVIRYSKFENKVIGLLLVKNENNRVKEFLTILDELKNDNSLPKNFTIALSDHRSPMARIDKILYQNGDDFLIEEIAGLKFKYYLDSFFQNNIEAFENTIKLIKSHIGDDSSKKILELYSGVGTIGMHFNEAKEVIGIEVIQSAVQAASENSKINNLTNYIPKLLASEKISSELLDGIDILIIDPPRTGLHKNVIKMILEKLPPKIIYLSCNPITQASDFNLIKDFYEIEYIAGMDYYPNTPHLESLIILKLKK